MFRKPNQLKNIFLCLLLTAGFLFPQTKSKISGVVKDASTGEPLIGVTIQLLDTRLGAQSDPDGNYFIVNVPVGVYSMRASMVGYTKKTVVDVLVSADRITTINFDLVSSSIQGEEVVVTAQRNVLHKEVSNTQMVVTDVQIMNTAGIRDINAFLEKQPGVSSESGFLEIRGGSADQTGTFINGMAYNNAAVGNAETVIPLSAIEQVSLLSGGFNAEYGNFRSGLINVTTKSGSRSKYHGTLTLSKNNSHMKRFGDKLSDPLSPDLAPFLDADIAFVGTAEALKNDPYLLNQYESFAGWNKQAETFNESNPTIQATPLDYYLLAAWMHMAIPDYEGLARQGYTVSEEQKKLFEDHARKEEGSDYNIDGGFGGPIPFFSQALGDATFYISHTSKEKYYVIPLSTRRSEKTHVTMATIKSVPDETMTLTFNGLWKRQLGLSPIKPAFGDSPDAGNEGGFMQIDNLKIFSGLQAKDNGVNYWYDPEMFPLLDETTLMGGANLNYVINNTSYFELSSSYLSIKDHSPTGDNRDMTAVTYFGPFPVTEMPYGKLQFASNDRVTWISNGDTIKYTYPDYDAISGISRRFRSKEGDLYTNVHSQQFRIKLDFVSQFGEHHYIKSGAEYNRIELDHKMWMKWNRTGPYNSYEYNYHRVPSQTGFYLQDQITYQGIVGNLGMRMDYFYGGGGLWPSGDPFAYAFTAEFGGAPRSAGAAADSFYAILASGRSLIWEKWETYNKEHPGFLQPVKNHFTISPRIGISFPITEDSKFYFNYGHFRSNPPYSSMFLYRYRYDKNGLYDMSNPNLEPPKTISYELGATYNFYENYILTLSGYYKDITGQQGEITYRNSDGTVNYSTWANNEYQDIQGLEINLTKNDNTWITGWINFNYMLKKSGNTGRSEITDATVGNDKVGLYEGNEDRFMPQPIFNANISFRTPDDIFSGDLLNSIFEEWRMTIFAEYKAGSYFTYNPLEKDYVNNNMQWPDYYMLDIRLSKTFSLFGFNTTLFLDINNICNLKVSLLSKGYVFRKSSTDTDDFTNWQDTKDYLSSLHLPVYNSPEYDAKRNKEKGLYIPGDDEIGDLRSAEKPYINDPDFASYFMYGEPRDIWFGIKIDF